MYSKEDYLKNFSQADSDILLHRLAHGELTDDARNAITQLLAERGHAVQEVVAADISDEMVLAHAMTIRSARCPRCRHAHSVVELRKEHWVWSVIVLTRFGTRTSLICRNCGRSRNLKAIGRCALLGWWGIPFGILITPYKIFANVGELLSKDRLEPSVALLNLARSQLATSAASRMSSAGSPVANAEPSVASVGG